MLQIHRYAYYLCFKCKKPYHGGERVCEAAGGGAAGEGGRKFRPEDLTCPSCLPQSAAQSCAKHGKEYLEYKCRFCCSVAVFFCFGTTHFCNSCHDRPGMMQRMEESKTLPSCPAGPQGKQLPGKPVHDCPLKIEHPPTGEEFALGCGICRNAQQIGF